MLICISATKKRDPKKYKWYAYQGRTATFDVDKDYEFSLSKGETFGVKKIKGFYYLVDASDLIYQFKLKPFDAKRILANSKGYSGKVGRVRVAAGTEGGKDRKRLVRENLVEVRIDSSMLQNVWYDKKNQKLYVTFPNGAEWEYSKVTPQEVLSFERSKSQGRWFNLYIKGIKDSERIEHQ